MFSTIVAFAEGEAAQTAAQTAQTAQTGSLLSAFLPMIIVIVLLYFMMIRPQKKREKETQSMQDSLRVGDKIVTIGGIAGRVAKIKDEYVYIETGMPGVPEKSYIKMERSSIKEVTKKAEDNKKKTVTPAELPEDTAEESNDAE